MQRMLDEGTHSWYYMIVCCKIPQPTCKENSTSNHLTQHSWSIIILLPKQKTGLQWQDWKWRNQLLFHVKCLAPNLQKAPFHVCFTQKILQKRPNSLHDSYIVVRYLNLPAKACIWHSFSYLFWSFLAHNRVASPTQSTGLPRQDWKKWRSQLLFQVRSLAPSNLQNAQIFRPLTPSMQRMLDEGTHSWYYMIVCCKIPQPTCKENSTSNHLTQHSWSIIILLILGRICIPWPKQKTGLQWQDWKWRNQLLFHVKCLAPNLQKAPFHVCFIQKILQKRPNSLHDSYIVVRYLNLPAKACVWHSFSYLFWLICIASPTQSTGLPRQDWKKWRSQLLFQVRSLAPSNLQNAQIFRPLTPSMQRMLDEGTHSWYYMIVCCKIPQPTCKENSTSNHLTQHSWSIIILLILGRICIPWPKQKTGLQWQDWKWRNQLLFHVRCLAPSNVQGLRFLSHISWVQLEITWCFLYRETGHPPQSSGMGTAVHHFQRAWHFQGSAKGKTAGETGKKRSLVHWVRSWACPIAKQPSVSAIVVDVDSTLNVLKWRGLMHLAATWSTNQRTWSVQESKVLVCDILFWRWQSWNVHITKYH